MQSRLSDWLMRCAQAILPNHCALCGNLSQHAVCPSCDSAASLTVPRCARCAAVLGRAPAATSAATSASASSIAPGAGDTRHTCHTRHTRRLCGTCVTASPAFDATLAYADYAAPYDALAQGLKFSARLGLAPWFAARIAMRVAEAGIVPDLILAVPLSAQRLAQRGYNQSWEIARPLARRLGVATHATLLCRPRHTRPQTELGDARQRRHNVRGAFAVRACSAARVLRGAHVAVVDDVMTSGATLHEIARLLKQAGAVRVTGLIALRTPPPHAARPRQTSRPLSYGDL